MISADIAGLNRVRGTLLAASATIATQAGQHVRNTALDVEATAKTLAPVRTGNLRRSITHQVNNVPGGVEATIGTNVEYAHYLEHGTSRMAPRAFMGPALDRHSGEFTDGLARLGGSILG